MTSNTRAVTSPASRAAVHVGASKNHFRAQVTAAATE